MFRRVVTRGILALALGVFGAAVGAFEPEPVRHGPDPAAQNAVDRTLAIIEVVLDRHVTPPTRQEMVLNAARSAYQAAGKTPPHRLATRISELTSRDDLRSVLMEVAEDLAKVRFPRPPRTATAIESGAERTLSDYLAHGVAQTTGGSVRLVSTKEANVEEQIQGNRYVGIGISLSSGENNDGFPKVHLLPEGPAARAGLRDEDLILSIDDVPTHEKKLEEIIDRIRGPAGTQVRLEVRSASEKGPPRIVTVTRGLVPMKTLHGLPDPSQPHGSFRLAVPSSIGYVKLHQIRGSAPHELAQLEVKLVEDGCEALIVDLRDADSSDLHHAVLLIDALLDGGLIGSVQTAGGKKEFQADSGALFRNWPLAILVNEGTRGTAEWVAASLQDRMRAMIVGTTTTAGDAYIREFVAVPGTELSLQLPTGILIRPSGGRLARVDVQDSRTRTRHAMRSPDQALSPASGGVIPNHAVPNKGKTLGDVVKLESISKDAEKEAVAPYRNPGVAPRAIDISGTGVRPKVLENAPQPQDDVLWYAGRLLREQLDVRHSSAKQ